MKMLMADEFLYFLRNYRAVWIQGRLGGGKTSLAVILAGYLKTKGEVQRVHANFPCSFSEKPGNLLYNAANIVDETHTFISSRKGVDTYNQFLRKLGIVLLMPSVLPPHYLLTKFSVQRLFNGYFAGLPVWIYKWILSYRNIQEKGNFAIWEPHHIFPFYDTRQIPFSDGGIADGMDRAIAYERYLTFEYESGLISLDEMVKKQDDARATLSPNYDMKNLSLFQDAQAAPKKDIIIGKKNTTKKDEPNENFQGIIDEIQDALAENQDNQEQAVRQIKRIARSIKAR